MGTTGRGAQLDARLNLPQISTGILGSTCTVFYRQGFPQAQLLYGSQYNSTYVYDDYITLSSALLMWMSANL